MMELGKSNALETDHHISELRNWEFQSLKWKETFSNNFMDRTPSITVGKVKWERFLVDVLWDLIETKQEATVDITA